MVKHKEKQAKMKNRKKSQMQLRTELKSLKQESGSNMKVLTCQQNNRLYPLEVKLMAVWVKSRNSEQFQTIKDV